MITVYASIGNSDDKLTQKEWAGFCDSVAAEIDRHADQVHGQWYSKPDAPFQNATFCFEIPESAAMNLRWHLGEFAAEYRQDSIAWAVVAETAFIGPNP